MAMFKETLAKIHRKISLNIPGSRYFSYPKIFIFFLNGKITKIKQDLYSFESSKSKAILILSLNSIRKNLKALAKYALTLRY